MSLRRSALSRRTELHRRTPMPRGKRELKARAARTIARQRQNTGPTQRVRGLVAERASWCCELCGDELHDGWQWTAVHSFHHRQPRGAGGTTRVDINSPANLMLVCGTGTTGCHGIIESNRTTAYEMGWLVRRPTDPAEVPVAVVQFPAERVVLTATGAYEQVAA